VGMQTKHVAHFATKLGVAEGSKFRSLLQVRSQFLPNADGVARQAVRDVKLAERRPGALKALRFVRGDGGIVSRNLISIPGSVGGMAALGAGATLAGFTGSMAQPMWDLVRHKDQFLKEGKQAQARLMKEAAKEQREMAGYDPMPRSRLADPATAAPGAGGPPGMTLDEKTGYYVDTKKGLALDPKTGLMINLKTREITDAATGKPVDEARLRALAEQEAAATGAAPGGGGPAVPGEITPAPGANSSIPVPGTDAPAPPADAIGGGPAVPAESPAPASTDSPGAIAPPGVGGVEAAPTNSPGGVQAQPVG